jgi:hypothetical protein
MGPPLKGFIPKEITDKTWDFLDRLCVVDKSGPL